MPLTDARLRALKPDGRAKKIADANGLHILLTANGSKLWRFSYRYLGRQKTIALGAYPLVSLSEARQARDAVRKQLINGIDPSEARRREDRIQRMAADNTFRGVAEEWFKSRRRRWAKSYADRLRSRLDADLLPRLGGRPIADIEPLEVLDVIRRIERRDAIEMAKRVMQMAGAIFRYGVATARCPRDPTADLRGALKEPGPPNHRSALSAGELPEFLRRLEVYDGQPTTRLGLELVVHTFVRTSEVRFARWSEFEDLDGAQPLWRIPAERMKMRRPHLVPLSRQAVAIVRALRAHSGRSGYLLPAATAEGVISGNTLIYALYRMGYHSRATVHGFRSTASTVLNEQQFNRDWIEMQLAHSDQSVRAVYNAAQWLPGRREMMQWWSDYLDEARASRAPLSPEQVSSVFSVLVGRRSRWMAEDDAVKMRRPPGRPPKSATPRAARRRA